MEKWGGENMTREIFYRKGNYLKIRRNHASRTQLGHIVVDESGNPITISESVFANSPRERKKFWAEEARKARSLRRGY